MPPNNKKISIIVLKIAVFVLVEAMITWPYALAGTSQSCLSPAVQVDTPELQDSFARLYTDKEYGDKDPGFAIEDVSHQEFSWRTRDYLVKQLTKGGLKDEVFDVFICGGGIAGTSVARDAASRGLKTMIVERMDWANGASGSSTNILHRGVLYFSQAGTVARKALLAMLNPTGGGIFNPDARKEILLDLKSAWVNVRFTLKLLQESETIAKQSPQITKLKPAHLVVNKEDKHSLFSAYAVIMLHWAMSGFAHERPRVCFGWGAIAKNFPELNAETVKGVVTFHEYVTDDAVLTVYTAKDAYRHGAVTLNNAPVKHIQYDTVNGYYVITIQNGTWKGDELFTVKAKCLVNAGGAGIDIIHDKLLEDDAVQKEARKYLSPDGSFLTPVTGGHLAVSAETLGSDRTYLVSITHGHSDERKNIFLTYRNESEKPTEGYYLLDTHDWIGRPGYVNGGDYELTKRIYKDLSPINTVFYTGLDMATRLYLEADDAVKKLNQLFRGAKLESPHQPYSPTEFTWDTKPFPYTSSSEEMRRISREHKIVNILDRYFVLMGVKIVAGRAAAEDMVDTLCDALGYRKADYGSKTSTLPLHIPEDVYRLPGADKDYEQMILQQGWFGKGKDALQKRVVLKFEADTKGEYYDPLDGPIIKPNTLPKIEPVIDQSI